MAAILPAGHETPKKLAAQLVARYRLDGYTLHLNDVIGTGSYGAVVRATRKVNGKQESCVAKIMDLSQHKVNPRKHFLQYELHVISNIHHPHIVEIFAIFREKDRHENDKTVLIFMAVAERGDLVTIMERKKGAIGEKQARIWVAQMASAIEYMHGKHIAHR